MKRSYQYIKQWRNVLTKIVNLYCGPGGGKSSTAADLFSLMKWEGENCELVTEFAKDLTWDGHFDTLADQLWVSGNQNRRLQRLIGKVDYIITDSPLVLCQVYAGDYFPTFTPFIQEIHNSYNNIEVFLNREKPYVAKGRSQTEVEARTIDVAIQRIFLDQNKRFDLVVDGNPDAKYTIYNYIKQNRA